MPFFAGGSNVVTSGGHFNSIEGNSSYYNRDGTAQNFSGNPNPYRRHIRESGDHTATQHYQRPTVPAPGAVRNDFLPSKVPPRRRPAEKQDIDARERISATSSDEILHGPEVSLGYLASVTRDDRLAPSKETEHLPEISSTSKQLEVDEVEAWTSYVHPEGWYYYFRRQHDKLDPDNIDFHEIRGALEDTLTTSAWTTPPKGTAAANKLTNYKPFSGLARRHSVPCGGLHVQTYVDHSRLFASEDKQALLEKSYTTEEANELQLCYWMLLSDYPSHNSLPPGAVMAARQALNCYVIEGLWKKSASRAPFTLAESRELLEYLDNDNSDSEAHQSEKDMKEPPITIPIPSLSPLRTALVSWVLFNVVKHQKSTKYGRITFKEAREAEKFTNISFVFALISVVCFFAPPDHRKHICAAKKSSDLRGDVETWPAYIDGLVKEWSTFNLAATVLLSASVGFLAVPGIDSLTRLIVLLSVVLTLGSIMTGVYLIWRHQSGEGRLEYFVSLLSTDFRIDCLAIILSTPFTFLAWGVLTFLVAVITYSFFGFQSLKDGRNIPVQGKGSILVIIFGILVVVAMLVSFIFFRIFRKQRPSV